MKESGRWTTEVDVPRILNAIAYMFVISTLPRLTCYEFSKRRRGRNGVEKFKGEGKKERMICGVNWSSHRLGPGLDCAETCALDCPLTLTGNIDVEASLTPSRLSFGIYMMFKCARVWNGFRYMTARKGGSHCKYPITVAIFTLKKRIQPLKERRYSI